MWALKVLLRLCQSYVVDDVKIIGYAWLGTIGRCITWEAWELCVYFLLVWVWGMGSINIIWWFITIEKCLGKLMEFTESEIGRIWPLGAHSCFTFVVIITLYERFKHEAINLFGEHLCYQYMHLLVLVWIDPLGDYVCPSFPYKGMNSNVHYWTLLGCYLLYNSRVWILKKAIVICKAITTPRF
jgi:hypothetical protein